MSSDREVVAAIKDRINLVDLIGRNVKLRRSGGSEWVGCCPFHGERTPSFYVIPNKQMFHCFGCGEHGDALSYLMKQENLTFPEALEQLAAQTGVDLPKRENRDRQKEEAVDRLRAVLEESQAFFAAQLISEEDAMCYLQGRGLTSGFVTEAGLGVAPPTWDMLSKHLQGQGFKGEDIVAAGVGAVGQRGGIIDAMRNRITIPIRDHRGKLVAFGGRVLDEAKPKYLNTKETALFSKGEVLFGLHEAKGHVQEGALVVEGYFDVLTLQMLGLGMAVAPLGTALTEAHLDRLSRYTKRLTLCFDGDAAGHKAMEKSLQLALPKGFDVRLLELPDGEDPDTWAMRVGCEAFRELIQKAPDWTSFKVQRAIKDRDMRKTPERMAVLGEITPFFVYVPQEARETFSATLAHLLQLPLSEVQRIAGTGHSEAAPRSPKKPERPAVDPAIQVDEAIKALAVAWIDPTTKATIQGAPRDWWLHLAGACLLEEILDEGGAELSTVAERLFREAEARFSIGRIPNVTRLLASLESAYIEAQLRQLRMGMEDPKTPPESIPAYEKAQLDLLERRSKLNRRASS